MKLKFSKSFWKGFFSVFDFSSFSSSRAVNQRVDKALKESRAAQSWYHEGQWYEHPLYGDAYKDKKK